MTVAGSAAAAAISNIIIVVIVVGAASIRLVQFKLDALIHNVGDDDDDDDGGDGKSVYLCNQPIHARFYTPKGKRLFKYRYTSQ